MGPLVVKWAYCSVNCLNLGMDLISHSPWDFFSIYMKYGLMIIYLPIFNLSHGVINKGCVGWVWIARVKGALTSSALVWKKLLGMYLPIRAKWMMFFLKNGWQQTHRKSESLWAQPGSFCYWFQMRIIVNRNKVIISMNHRHRNLLT